MAAYYGRAREQERETGDVRVGDPECASGSEWVGTESRGSSIGGLIGHQLKWLRIGSRASTANSECASA